MSCEWWEQVDGQVTQVTQTGKLPSPLHTCQAFARNFHNALLLLSDLSLTFLKVPRAGQKYSKVQITFTAFDNISSDDRSLQAISVDSPPPPIISSKKICLKPAGFRNSRWWRWNWTKFTDSSDSFCRISTKTINSIWGKFRYIAVNHFHLKGKLNLFKCKQDSENEQSIGCKVFQRLKLTNIWKWYVNNIVRRDPSSKYWKCNNLTYNQKIRTVPT